MPPGSRWGSLALGPASQKGGAHFFCNPPGVDVSWLRSLRRLSISFKSRSIFASRSLSRLSESAAGGVAVGVGKRKGRAEAGTGAGS